MKENYQNNAEEISFSSYNLNERHDFAVEEILQLFALSFSDLVFKAAQIHRQFHDQNKVQISTLLSIKTGSCPENCKY